MGNIGVLFQLSRPVNTLITILSVFVATLITGTIEPFTAVIFACVSAGSIAAAANTINDYYDVEIDRINKPHRPLSARKLTARTALIAALAEYAFGNLLAIFISLPMLIIAFIVSALTYFYSAYLKRTVLWGNFAVSLITAAAFIYGGLAVNRPTEAIIPAIFAFFFHFGREIIKDIEDLEGDREGNANTFPVRFGIGPAVFLIRINFIGLIVLTMIPFSLGWYGMVYMLIVAAGIYPVIIYVLTSILKNTQSSHLGFLSNLLKADMLIGLLAIYFR